MHEQEEKEKGSPIHRKDGRVDIAEQVDAVRLAMRGGFGRMVALKNSTITDIPLEEALAVPKRVDLSSDGMLTARGLGICFGD